MGRAELADTVTCLQQELADKNDDIQAMEERTHEAEVRLSEATTNVKCREEEKSKLRGENKALSAANKVAQDWMSKAMKHNENLKQKLAETTRRNDELKLSLHEDEETEKPSVT